MTGVSKSWTYQRNLLIKNYNPIVNEYFGDLDPNETDFNTGRSALKEGCLIDAKDGQIIAYHKMQFFYNVILEVHEKPALYGIPIDSFKETMTTLPQITCHWKERDDIAKTNNRPPIQAQCTLRYKGDISSATDLTTLGNHIKSIFDTPQHHFSKGKLKYSYWDAKNGIYLKGFFTSESDAETLFKSMLDIPSGITYNHDFLNKSESPYRDWTPSGTEMIGGDSLKLPQQRISGEVYFQYAELKHQRLHEDIILYSAVPQRRRMSLV